MYKISVVIPLYNKRNLVERAINSVFAQSYSPYEVIVVNNNSTDQGDELVKRVFSEKVKLIDQAQQGVSLARNKGIEIATGDYVAFLDADDEWLPNHLQSLVQAINMLDSKPELVANGYLMIEKNLSKREVKSSNKASGREEMLSLLFKGLSFGCMPFFTSSVMVKRELLVALNGFDTNLHYGEDIFLWCKILANHEGVLNPQLGAVYHREAENRSDVFALSRLPLGLIARLKSWENTIQLPSSLKPLFRAMIQSQQITALVFCLKAGQKKVARSLFFSKDTFAKGGEPKHLAILLLLLLPAGITKAILQKKLG